MYRWDMSCGVDDVNVVLVQCKGVVAMAISLDTHANQCLKRKGGEEGAVAHHAIVDGEKRVVWEQ